MSVEVVLQGSCHSDDQQNIRYKDQRGTWKGHVQWMFGRLLRVQSASRVEAAMQLVTGDGWIGELGSLGRGQHAAESLKPRGSTLQKREWARNKVLMRSLTNRGS